MSTEKKKPSYARSYEQMIDYILQFSTSRSYGPDAHAEYPSRRHGSTTVFVPCGADELQPGDLVLISAANYPAGRLSWYISHEKPEGWADYKYILKSAKTGEEIEWTNIGLSVLNRFLVSRMPHWRWTDDQWENWDNLDKAFREHGHMMGALLYPEYESGPDGRWITIRVRARYGLLEQGAFAQMTLPVFPIKEDLPVLIKNLNDNLDLLLEARKAMKK